MLPMLDNNSLIMTPPTPFFPPLLRMPAKMFLLRVRTSMPFLKQTGQFPSTKHCTNLFPQQTIKTTLKRSPPPIRWCE